VVCVCGVESGVSDGVVSAFICCGMVGGLGVVVCGVSVVNK